MKPITIIIIALVVILVVAIITGAWYFKTKFYVPDKDGMVYSLSDTITSCYYECGGGMNGEYTEYCIYVKDNNEVWFEHHYRYPVGIDKDDITTEHQVDESAIKDIRDICKKYAVLSWGKLKLSNVIVHDGETEVIGLNYSDKEYYYFNSGYVLPDDCDNIYDEIVAVMERYK